MSIATVKTLRRLEVEPPSLRRRARWIVYRLLTGDVCVDELVFWTFEAFRGV